MKSCSRCNNYIWTRKVLRKTTGPLCTPLYKEEEYCEYCEWKGDSGPGKLMKVLLGTDNRRSDWDEVGRLVADKEKQSKHPWNRLRRKRERAEAWESLG